MVSERGERCPKCGAEGKYQGEHETVVRNYKINGLNVADVGWRCWLCSHVWGFEISSNR